MGSDGAGTSLFGGILAFQSTLPAWGATLPARAIFSAASISIHAPRMGSDITSTSHIFRSLDFNPRSPHGERPNEIVICGRVIIFQSTLPAWGATSTTKLTSYHRRISIHAPRMGSDLVTQAGVTSNNISIHAPRMGSD